MPILESRFQIYALLQQGFNQVSPSAAAKKDAVVIGHSMGGILARLLVSDTDLTQPAMQMLKNRRLERFKSDPLLQARLRLKPITNFNRAIFLAAPHKGTEFADRWFTLAARKVIRLPTAFLSAFADTLQQHEVDLKNLNQRNWA